MMFNVAATAQNNQIGNIIIRSIMVYMMNIQNFRFVANSTEIRKLRESIFSISSYPSQKLTILFCSRLRFITTRNRTKLFLKEFSSRFWETKIITAALTLSSDLRLKFYGLISAFTRTTNCFISRDSQDRYRKFFATYTNQFNLFLFKFIAALQRTKKIFIFFCLPKLCFKSFFTKRTSSFHIRHHHTQEVLCR